MVVFSGHGATAASACAPYFPEAGGCQAGNRRKRGVDDGRGEAGLWSGRGTWGNGSCVSQSRQGKEDCGGTRLRAPLTQGLGAQIN